jgi:hypothetical protein
MIQAKCGYCRRCKILKKRSSLAYPIEPVARLCLSPRFRPVSTSCRPLLLRRASQLSGQIFLKKSIVTLAWPWSWGSSQEESNPSKRGIMSRELRYCWISPRVASMALQGSRLQNPVRLDSEARIRCCSPAIGELSHMVLSSERLRR